MKILFRTFFVATAAVGAARAALAYQQHKLNQQREAEWARWSAEHRVEERDLTPEEAHESFLDTIYGPRDDDPA